MRVVVADSTPLHYLILIGSVDILPRIFQKIHIPGKVRDELTCEGTPSGCSRGGSHRPSPSLSAMVASAFLLRGSDL